MKQKSVLLLPAGIILWILVWLSLSPSQQVLACSPLPTSVRCQRDSELFANDLGCLNGDCSIRFEVDENDYLSIFQGEEIVSRINDESVEIYWWGHKDRSWFSSEVLDSFCQIDLANSQSIIPLFQNWLDTDSHGFNLESYSPEKEKELMSIQSNLLSCRDVTYATENGAIASFSFQRSYCGLSTPLIPCGPAVLISPIKFALFVFSHPGATTFPYILGFLAILLLMLSGIIYLQKKGDLIFFFYPSKLHTWGLAIGVPILCFLSTFMTPYLIYQLFAFYLVLSTVNYLIQTRKKSASFARN
jgi:hypothetical protein